MKTLSMLVGCWMLGASCLAQDAPPQAADPFVRKEPLSENATIHVRGLDFKELVFDLELSGTGPFLQYDGYAYVNVKSTNSYPTTVNVDASLFSCADGKVAVEYRIKAGDHRAHKAGDFCQFRDTTISGRFIAAYGEDIKIASLNGKDWIFTVTKYAKSKK